MNNNLSSASYACFYLMYNTQNQLSQSAIYSLFDYERPLIAKLPDMSPFVMKKGWTHELTFLQFCIFDGEHSVQYSLRDLVN